MLLVEVVSDIWIGDTNIVAQFIKEKDIKYIINCQEDLGFFGKSRDYIDSIKEDMMKKEIGALQKYLFQMTQHILQNVKRNEAILIVCQSGLKKAPLLALGYLIRYGHMSLDKALSALNTKMPRKVILTELDKYALLYFQQEVARQINN